MLIMDYPSIRGGYLPYYAKKTIWNLLQAYIDAHIQRIFSKNLGDGVQALSIIQNQFSNMTCYDQSRYNSLFQKVVHKEGYYAIN